MGEGALVSFLGEGRGEGRWSKEKEERGGERSGIDGG